LGGALKWTIEGGGIIEKSIDFVLKHDVVPDVEFMRGLIPLKSYEDTVLGYQLGLLKNQIYFMLMISSGLRIVPVEDKNQVDEILKRRVLEIREKIFRELGK
jgi:hypothetical protein